ncbi:MAG: hypothetical protein HOY79_17685 [Streptomyces sp.]|nr:hypothetical protein [Streptomyces sp.]
MPDLDVNELARTLEKTSANLKRHIADEAQKRAAELGKTYAKAADERIRDNAVDLQRAQDFARELRRQIVPLDRRSVTLKHLEDALRDVVRVAKESGGDIPVKVVVDAVNEARAAGYAAPSRWNPAETTQET